MALSIMSSRRHPFRDRLSPQEHLFLCSLPREAMIALCASIVIRCDGRPRRPTWTIDHAFIRSLVSSLSEDPDYAAQIETSITEESFRQMFIKKERSSRRDPPTNDAREILGRWTETKLKRSAAPRYLYRKLCHDIVSSKLALQRED